MMTLRDLFELNERLTKDRQFSKWQWEEIVNEAYAHGGYWSFDESVENFYTGLLGFDYEDCEDLVTDIQNGNGDAFERFINDIINYFNNE
jgi:hypothetical protein